MVDYTLTLRNAQDLFREVILVAYWPTRVHDHQTALKQSTAGGSCSSKMISQRAQRLGSDVVGAGARDATRRSAEHLACTTDEI